MLNSEPSNNVPGYIARRIASKAVGRKGEPAIGGVFTFVAVRLDEGVPFVVGGIGISTRARDLRLRVSMTL